MKTLLHQTVVWTEHCEPTFKTLKTHLDCDTVHSLISYLILPSHLFFSKIKYLFNTLIYIYFYSFMYAFVEEFIEFLNISLKENLQMKRILEEMKKFIPVLMKGKVILEINNSSANFRQFKKVSVSSYTLFF